MTYGIPVIDLEDVPLEAVRAWADTLSPAPQMRVLPGASHFFHGRLNELRDEVLAFMASQDARA